MSLLPQENTTKICSSDERRANRFATAMTVFDSIANGETLPMAIDSLVANSNQNRLQVAMAIDETLTEMQGESRKIIDVECQKTLVEMSNGE